VNRKNPGGGVDKLGGISFIEDAPKSQRKGVLFFYQTEDSAKGGGKTDDVLKGERGKKRTRRGTSEQGQRGASGER